MIVSITFISLFLTFICALSTGSGVKWKSRRSHVHLAADDPAGRFAEPIAHGIAENSAPGELI